MDKIDNRPPAVRLAAKTPGKYVFVSRFSAFFFEVDEEGAVHQLSVSSMTRDGLLDDGDWSPKPATQEAKVYRLEEVKLEPPGAPA